MTLIGTRLQILGSIVGHAIGGFGDVNGHRGLNDKIKMCHKFYGPSSRNFGKYILGGSQLKG